MSPRNDPSGLRPGVAGLPVPEAAERARSQQLLERILAAITRAGGCLPFDQYMQMALYEPGLGYYDADGRKFGSDGDFITAPEISPLFARALAVQVAQAFTQTPARILEFGAGTGALARELIAELQRLGCGVSGYDIVEVSADLRARQRERLAGLPVRWLDELPQTFAGVVIANEVLDVLPVQLFVRDGGTLHERGVCADGAQLRLGARLADAELRAAVAQIESLVGPLPNGYGSERCALAAGWLRSLAQCLEHGLILLLDYGFPRREYYHPQRAMGTLMCHYRQHAHADPLWMPGLNDITAHVDFTACAATAQDAGLDLLGYTSQAHFLLNCKILDLLSAAHTPENTAGVQRLLSEAEMGELVKVMALGRGFEGLPLGFARGDRSHRL